MLEKTALIYPASSAGASNPYSGILYAALAESGVRLKDYRPLVPLQSADVLHVQWLEQLYLERIINRSSVFSDCAFRNLMKTIARVKKNGGKLVWTAHNTSPHEAPANRHAGVWERWSREFYQQVDIVIALSNVSIPLIQQSYPYLRPQRFVVAPHPHYVGAYPAPSPSNNFRRELNLTEDNFVMCAIGLMRPYKGLLELARHFHQIGRKDEALVFAGECFQEDYLAKLRDIADQDPRIKLVPRRLADQELSDLYAASNLSIFNFVSILNSGSVLTALSQSVPVLAPALGSLPEVASDVGEQWCQLFSSPLSAKSLRNHLDVYRQRPVTGTPRLSEYDPKKIARIHREAYFGK